MDGNHCQPASRSMVLISAILQEKNSTATCLFGSNHTHVAVVIFVSVYMRACMQCVHLCACVQYKYYNCPFLFEQCFLFTAVYDLFLYLVYLIVACS